MRFATIRTDQGTTAARLDGDVLVRWRPATSGPCWPRAARAERDGAAAVPAAQADFAPVVTRPDKIICVGLNYRSHILETGRELPEYPTLFAKFAETLTGPRDDLVIPSVSERVDWEVELGVVIGRPVYRATPEEASAAIAGYTVINDVSMRDWQRRTLQWLAGKMFQHSTPAGPYLVTPDEVGDAADLEVRCEVDGAVMQQSRTSDLLFSPAQIVSYASQAITLRPGDLIATGTCGGVGDARKPPVYLQPGNLLRTWIEGLGECLNQCVPDKTPIANEMDRVGTRPVRSVPYSPEAPVASSVTMSRWPTCLAYSWTRWNRTRSRVAGSAPSHRSPGWPTSSSRWASMMARLRAAWACRSASSVAAVSSGPTDQRSSRRSPHGSPTSRPSKPHSSQRSST